jgi:hypothetical protein
MPRSESYKPSPGTSRSLSELVGTLSKMRKAMEDLPAQIELMEKSLLITTRGILTDAGVDIDKVVGLPNFQMLEDRVVVHYTLRDEEPDKPE